MAKRTNWAAVAGIVGAVIFGGLVLAVVYWPGSRSTVIGDSDQAKVLAAIRKRSIHPSQAVDVVTWWPRRSMAHLGEKASVCRLVYRAKNGFGHWELRDGVYRVDGPQAVAVDDCPNSIESHATNDSLFPCDNCPEMEAIKQNHKFVEAMTKAVNNPPKSNRPAIGSENLGKPPE